MTALFVSRMMSAECFSSFICMTPFADIGTKLIMKLSRLWTCPIIVACLVAAFDEASGSLGKPTAQTIAGNAQAKVKISNNPDEEGVVNISDATFFGALNPAHPGMQTVVQCARARNYPAAWQAWDDYARKNLKPIGELREVEELRKKEGGKRQGGRDPWADPICNHVINASPTQRVDFGKQMDWTRVQGTATLYAFHYWNWSAPLWAAYQQFPAF